MGDGDSVYSEAFSQFVERAAGLVGGEEIVDLSGPEPPLDLLRRFGNRRLLPFWDDSEHRGQAFPLVSVV
jgi:hypothetical protein